MHNKHSLAWMDDGLFIHLFTDEYLGRFEVLAFPSADMVFMSSLWSCGQRDMAQ
jgi:hypothetical protein